MKLHKVLAIASSFCDSERSTQQQFNIGQIESAAMSLLRSEAGYRKRDKKINQDMI
jgi:hypothetical protein